MASQATRSINFIRRHGVHRIVTDLFKDNCDQPPRRSFAEGDQQTCKTPTMSSPAMSIITMAIHWATAEFAGRRPTNTIRTYILLSTDRPERYRAACWAKSRGRSWWSGNRPHGRPAVVTPSGLLSPLPKSAIKKLWAEARGHRVCKPPRAPMPCGSTHHARAVGKAVTAAHAVSPSFRRGLVIK